MIFAVSFIALLLFVGLALDAGSMYVTYGQLKRAVDSAAVAAASSYKRGLWVDSMTASANEELQLHNIDTSTVDLVVHICDEVNNTTGVTQTCTVGSDIVPCGDGLRDTTLQTTAPSFYGRCPDTGADEAPRKLVYVQGTQHAPLFFLGLLGFPPVALTTNSVSEAAPVDVVLVIDISESMADNNIVALGLSYKLGGSNCTNPPNVTDCPNPYVDNYDPNNNVVGQPQGCNVTDNPADPTSGCRPLKDAKVAAKALINSLYSGYDQVGIITFDQTAVSHGMTYNLIHDPAHPLVVDAIDAIDNIHLHDDPPYAKLWPQWRAAPNTGKPVFNPVNPEDRDGDGRDQDNPCMYDLTNSDPATCQRCTLTPDRWDTSLNPYGWGGVPCDDNTQLDAYNWVDADLNHNGTIEESEMWIWTAEDDAAGRAWLLARDPYGETVSTQSHDSLSPISTCTGCGIRAASNMLREHGRPSSVWVMVLLSDGIVNLSDTPGVGSTAPNDTPDTGVYGAADHTMRDYYPNGFCSGQLTNDPVLARYWPKACVDNTMPPAPPLAPNPDIYKRSCIDLVQATCPPGSVWDGTTPNLSYSVLDYALDQIDDAALTKSTNLQEPRGNEIAIYTIGLGKVAGTVGEKFLRYAAAVGDDGDRGTDPCNPSPGDGHTCGQYYYAASGAQLQAIFEDIATRIYTRITD